MRTPDFAVVLTRPSIHGKSEALRRTQRAAGQRAARLSEAQTRRDGSVRAIKLETTMYKLYGRKGSGNVAVQVLLEEAGAPYEMVWVEDPKAPEFLRVNPNGKVPALQLPDGQLMYESAAMLAYLAETLPAAGMAPRPGSSQHALLLQWLVLLSAGTYESCLRYFYSERYGEAASVKASASVEIDRLYGVMEAELVRKGPFLCGSTPSAADVYLAMLASWYEPDLAALGRKFPAILALCEAIAARPSWKKVQAANAA
jgi:glutathione S-transferase